MEEDSIAQLFGSIEVVVFRLQITQCEIQRNRKVDLEVVHVIDLAEPIRKSHSIYLVWLELHSHAFRFITISIISGTSGYVR